MNSTPNIFAPDKMTCERLPPEILLKIFRLISREDLLHVCLVSKKFLTIASSSVFWRKLSPCKNKLVKNNACEDFLSLNRFNETNCFKFQGVLISVQNNKRLQRKEYEEVEQGLRNFLDICKGHKSIKSVTILSSNLKNVAVSNLIGVVKRLEAVDLTRSQLTKSQLDTIFESVSLFEKLKNLSLQGVNLSKISPTYFAQIGESLEHLNFSHTSLTKDQSTSLLQGIAKGKKMRSLKITDEKLILDGDESDTLAACITSQTESVNLSSSQISPPGLEAFISRLAQEPHSIKTLCLNSVYLGRFKWSSSMLATSLSDITRLELSGCLPKNKNIMETILLKMKLKRKVTSLDLSNNNLSDLDHTLLADTFSAMKNVDLSKTSLTKDQITALLTSFSQSTILEGVKLTDNDLSCVEAPLLGRLVTSLKSLNLINTKLKPDQAVEVITKGGKYWESFQIIICNLF